jgi:hypothetical protein
VRRGFRSFTRPLLIRNCVPWCRTSPKDQSRKPAEEDDELEDEEIVEGMTASNAGSDGGGVESDGKKPGFIDPCLQTEKPWDGTTGSSSSQVWKERKTANPPSMASSQKSIKSGRKSKLAQPKVTSVVSSSSKWQNPGPFVLPCTLLPPAKSQDTPNQTKPYNTTKPINEDVSNKVSQGEPPVPVDVVGDQDVGVTTPEVSPLRPVSLGPLSPRRPPAQSSKSDIESLYASPSPKTTTEIEPIELDSDPDFETMEKMLLSHRGPHSSQAIKKESPSQPPPTFKTPRPLKRQRSHPSPLGSSQALTQGPQTDSKPAKRPRVKGSHSFDSAVVLNIRKKHPEFWDLDGTVVLQVDNVIFRVMRSTLSKSSTWFRELFGGDFENLEIMAGCPLYVIEEDLSHLDFANLLSGLENGL